MPTQRVVVGDCREVMAGMEPASFDAVVCDPPYGLEFMGKEWDRLKGEPEHWNADQGRGEHARLSRRPSGKRGWDGYPERPRYGRNGAAMQEWHRTWLVEAFRVLKPGGALMAFGGTRTWHRLAVAIEDAGFAIFDCIAWVHGQGFPKHKTLLKPAWEPVLLCRKPLNDVPIDGTILGEFGDLLGGIVCLSWSDASNAVASLPSRLTAHGEAPVSAALIASVLPGPESEGSSARTATFNSPETAATCLSIASSWSGILAALSNPGSTFTTSTATELTTALRTLSCLLSATIPADIIEAASRPLGWLSSATAAASLSTGERPSRPSTPSAIAPALASLLRVASGTDARSAAERLRPIIPSVATVLSHALQRLTTELAANSGPRLEPIIVAKKPGRGGLNVEAGRISTAAGDYDHPGNADASETARPAVYGWAESGGRFKQSAPSDLGRWPANVALTHHDSCNGSCHPDCPVRLLDEASGESASSSRPRAASAETMGYGGSARDFITGGYDDRGGASRFFYCAKADRAERDIGMAGMPAVPAEVGGNGRPGQGFNEVVHGRAPMHRNHHPTVKPLALMQWLVRLACPVGGTLLDPFLGSGSTLIAADREGIAGTGIEQDAEYAAIARARIVGDCPLFAAVAD